MLKVLGSMLILLASVGFGFQIQMDLRNHLRLLYDIRFLLLDIANATAKNKTNFFISFKLKIKQYFFASKTPQRYIFFLYVVLLILLFFQNLSFFL